MNNFYFYLFAKDEGLLKFGMHFGFYYLENWAIFFQYSDITSQLSNPAYGKKGARGTEKREVGGFKTFNNFGTVSNYTCKCYNPLKPSDAAEFRNCKRQIQYLGNYSYCLGLAFTEKNVQALAILCKTRPVIRN